MAKTKRSAPAKANVTKDNSLIKIVSGIPITVGRTTPEEYELIKDAMGKLIVNKNHIVLARRFGGAVKRVWDNYYSTNKYRISMPAKATHIRVWRTQ